MEESSNETQGRGKPRSWVGQPIRVAVSAVVSAVIHEEVSDLLDRFSNEDASSE
ncbi:hypothetical protein ACIOHC_43645 [Streptomyces sp. NPDC088252]|uniref:hypothetical protein n=1 Tax=unclassified Streptomyces TaxID=2593676 RepID=UPI0038222821